MSKKTFFVRSFLSENVDLKEVEQFRSITCIMKMMAKDLDYRGAKKYKFTGNRALAKKTRGCSVPDPNKGMDA